MLFRSIILRILAEGKVMPLRLRAVDRPIEPWNARTVGGHFNEYLFVEIHYSGIGEDRGEKKEKLGLRGVLSL